MPKTMTVECWILVDENENYEVGPCQDSVVERFEESHGSLSEAGATRRVKVILQVPVPETAVMVGEVPAEGAAELAVS